MHARVKSAELGLGLMCYPMGGTIDGKYGDHILLAPPFIAAEAEIHSVASLIGQAIDSALVL